MFGISTTELIIILLVALIVLGPTQLPGIARSLGKALGEFRRMTTDVQRTLNLEAAKIEEEEREKKKAADMDRKAKEPTGRESPIVPPDGTSTKTKSDPPPDAAEDRIPPREHTDPNLYSTAQIDASATSDRSRPTSAQAPTPNPEDQADQAGSTQSSSAPGDADRSEHPKNAVVEPSKPNHSKAQA